VHRRRLVMRNRAWRRACRSEGCCGPWRPWHECSPSILPPSRRLSHEGMFCRPFPIVPFVPGASFLVIFIPPVRAGQHVVTVAPAAPALLVSFLQRLPPCPIPWHHPGTITSSIPPETQNEGHIISYLRLTPALGHLDRTLVSLQPELRC